MNSRVDATPNPQDGVSEELAVLACKIADGIEGSVGRHSLLAMRAVISGLRPKLQAEGLREAAEMIRGNGIIDREAIRRAILARADALSQPRD